MTRRTPSHRTTRQTRTYDLRPMVGCHAVSVLLTAPEPYTTAEWQSLYRAALAHVAAEVPQARLSDGVAILTLSGFLLATVYPSTVSPEEVTL